MRIFRNPFAIFLFLLLVINLIWDFKLQTTANHDTIWNFLFNASYGVMFISAGFYGIFQSFRVGILSPVAKTLLFVGLGVFFWGVGLFIWTYYNLVFKVDIPFPSLADAAFILIYPFVALGFILFLRIFKDLVSGHILRDAIIVFILSTVVVFFLARPDLNLTLPPIQLFFTIFYPLGDIILLALALITLRVGVGKIRSSLLALTLALLFNTAADILFTTRTAAGTYWNGDIADLLYTITTFVFGIALILIKEQAQPTI